MIGLSHSWILFKKNSLSVIDDGFSNCNATTHPSSNFLTRLMLTLLLLFQWLLRPHITLSMDNSDSCEGSCTMTKEQKGYSFVRWLWTSFRDRNFGQEWIAAWCVVKTPSCATVGVLVRWGASLLAGMSMKARVDEQCGTMQWKHITEVQCIVSSIDV